VKFSTPGIQLLIIAALCGGPARASAGELAARSRGSVSISITIPAHLVLKPAMPVADPGSGKAAQGFCIQANGLENFHLVVLGSGVEQAPLPRASGVRPIAQESCAGLKAEPGRAGHETALPVAAGGPSGAYPLTILVVPD
jgi:hypothetical protein